MTEDEGHPNQVIRVVSFTHPLILTRKQIEYMADIVAHKIGRNFNSIPKYQVIYAFDNKGWILVGNDHNFNDGDGVWVDTEGVEHHSP